MPEILMLTALPQANTTDSQGEKMSPTTTTSKTALQELILMDGKEVLAEAVATFKFAKELTKAATLGEVGAAQYGKVEFEAAVKLADEMVDKKAEDRAQLLYG